VRVRIRPDREGPPSALVFRLLAAHRRCRASRGSGCVAGGAAGAGQCLQQGADGTGVSPREDGLLTRQLAHGVSGTGFQARIALWS